MLIFKIVWTTLFVALGLTRVFIGRRELKSKRYSTWIGVTDLTIGIVFCLCPIIFWFV